MNLPVEIENSTEIADEIKIDTSTLKGKREWIFQEVGIAAVSDTLLDLNFDGHLDFVVKTYGASGTGSKNGAEVYLFNERTGCYYQNEQLENLPNPSFFLKERTITSFYIGFGSGSGKELKWKNGKWVTTLEFQVDNKEDETVWEIFYPLKNKRQKVKLPYQMFPPEKILKTAVEF